MATKAFNNKSGFPMNRAIVLLGQAMVILFLTTLDTHGDEPVPKEDAKTLEKIKWRREHRQGKVITALAYTPDGKHLAATSLDGMVKLYDADGTRCERIIKTTSMELYAIAVSPDGKLLASAGSCPEIQVWEIGTGKELKVLTGHAAPVAALAFSPDGRLLASGGCDGSIRLWDTATWSEKRKIGEGLGRVTSLSFSPKGTQLASGGTTLVQVRGSDYVSADNVRLWRVPEGAIDVELPVRACNVAFTPDGLGILAIGMNVVTEKAPGNGKSQANTQPMMINGYTGITWIDAKTRRVRLSTLEERAHWMAAGESPGRYAVISPDGTFFATVPGKPSHYTEREGNVVSSDLAVPWGVVLWEFGARRQVVRRSGSRWLPDRSEVCCTFSPQGDKLAVGHLSGAVNVWSLRGNSDRSIYPEVPAQGSDLANLWAHLTSGEVLEFAVGQTKNQCSEGIVCALQLVSQPARAVPFLADKLRPSPQGKIGR